MKEQIDRHYLLQRKKELKELFSEIPLMKGQRYVSLGCGTGADLVLLQDNFGELIGVDHHAEIIRFCKKHIQEPNIQFVNAIHLIWLEKQENESIDVITLLDIDSQCYPEETIQLAKQKLKTKGLLIITERDDNTRIYGRMHLPTEETIEKEHSNSFNIKEIKKKEKKKDNRVVILTLQ